MTWRHLMLALVLTTSLVSTAQGTNSGKCAVCDTNFYYIKKIGGELTAAYPEKIICYFTDSLGNKSNKKCLMQKFINGELNGSELSYYYSEKVYLVNWFGRKYKRPVRGLRKRIFASEMSDYSLEYKGYWKNGKKHGLWTYYNRDGKIVLVEEYKHGEFVGLR